MTLAHPDFSSRALFLSFEGIDGSGKSTQVTRLAKRLKAYGREPLIVREPGGTALSERVRDLLLDRQYDIVPRSELLLFAAARAQLVEERIRPALAEGRIVICDRFFDSSTAYQGVGRNVLDPVAIADFHRFTTDGLEPDRTYILDVPEELAARRRFAEADRMEASGIEFFRNVRAAYRQIADDEPDRVLLLDATATPDQVSEQIWKDLLNYTGTPGNSAGLPG